ncbi:hypothetical protein BYT27DRAFT_6405591 [Phlegmacium glaucopus]|nr:hypothetical protein BYT27DRAFT_6405591 [Phlegmacium glaucopus]
MQEAISYQISLRRDRSTWPDLSFITYPHYLGCNPKRFFGPIFHTVAPSIYFSRSGKNTVRYLSATHQKDGVVASVTGSKGWPHGAARTPFTSHSQEVEHYQCRIFLLNGQRSSRRSLQKSWAIGKRLNIRSGRGCCATKK